MEWKYISKDKKTTGYESVMKEMNVVSPEQFNGMGEEEKNQVVENIFNIIREINIFPIFYFNHEGAVEEIKKCIKKKVAIKDNVLNLKDESGQDLCRWLFPNLHKVDCKNTRNNSMYDRFFDDNKLRKTIAFNLKYEPFKNTYSNIYRPARLIGGNVATNFSPMKAKALYERYCPKDGIIYDFACGFGGRMLGALTSENNYKYFGVEPCTDTYEHLNELGELIEEATGRTGIFKVYKKGSEDFRLNNGNYCDFAFSSPPYFTLEKYSDEETQCYNKFPNLEEWFEGYVKPTIENIYFMLKPNCYYAVNIADFNMGKNRVEYVDKWVEISKEVGFEYVETITMKLTTRKGDGHKEDGKTKPKQEGIFVFRKRG